MEQMTAATKVWTRDFGTIEKRDVWPAIKRGFRGRCPRCGEGKLFRAFLKVDDNCPVCNLDFTPHRADDLPAYLVIVIVGHIIVPLVLLIETNYSPPVELQLAIYLPMTLSPRCCCCSRSKAPWSGCNGRCACTASTKMPWMAFRRSSHRLPIAS